MNLKLIPLLLLCASCAGCQILARLFPTPLPTTGGVDIQIVADNANFSVDIAAASDGRLFFTEKATGNIRVIKNGVLLPTPFANVPVNSFFERGLLGIALDPDFPNQPHVYVAYTRSSTGANSSEQNEASEYRLVRFTANDDVASGSEHLIMNLPLGSAGFHNGGILRFGNDGKLYVSVGELGVPDNARSLQTDAGKILRINPDGSTPTDNPFGALSRVFAFGLRNTFGLCQDSSGRWFGNENGSGNHDEVNILEAGKDYGWSLVEGFADDAAGDPSGEITFAQFHADYRDPIVDKSDGSVGAAGAAFINSSVYGADVAGSVVYGQLGLNRVLRIVVNGTGTVTSQTTFVEDLPSEVNGMCVDPEGYLWLACGNNIIKVIPAQP